jgi:hypothetical protein
MIPVETVPEIEGEGAKGEWCRGWIQYDVFDIL